jgi:hypothetical protein
VSSRTARLARAARLAWGRDFGFEEERDERDIDALPHNSMEHTLVPGKQKDQIRFDAVTIGRRLRAVVITGKYELKAD